MRVQPSTRSKKLCRKRPWTVRLPDTVVATTRPMVPPLPSRRHSRPFQRVSLRSFLAVVVIVVVNLLGILDTVQGQSSQSQNEPQCKPQEPTKYDWERLDYYELLGLEEEDTGSKKKKKKKKKVRTPATSNSNSNSDSSDEEGRAISSKEIRKAYRKQAQKYHPDKQASKKKSSANGSRNSNNSNKTSTSTSTSTSSSTSSEALSVEESNARFAKIAEAYEFLLDDTKRKDYDLFLEYCHNTEIVKDDDVHEGRLSTVLKKRFHGLFDNLVGERDPFKLFKDVFFGGDDTENDDDDVYFDPDDPFSHLRYENNPQWHPNHQQDHHDEEPYDPQEDPVRVFHEKRFMYDPMTGENVVRVLQTEEYAPTKATRGSTRGGNTTENNATANSTSSSSSSLFYYRIVAQDFEERYDPYNAKQVYVPITEPYLQEDGERTASASRDHTAKSKSSSRDSASVESILHPWEVLTPNSPPMVSPNKRYIAGLSPDCELLVMINPDRSRDDNQHEDGYEYDSSGNYRDGPPEILWSTQRPYGNNGYVSDNCFALLKGPHLVVTVGQHPHHAGGSHHNNRILWHSDGRSDEDDSKHGYYEYEDEFGFWHKRQRSYLAQLDNDGSLTVYSVWSVPQDPSDGPQHRSHSVGQPLPGRSKVLVATVAKAAKDIWHGRIPTKNQYDHLYSTSRSLTYKRCVYSTYGGKLPLGIGCCRISRRLNQLAIEVVLAVRKLIFQINTFADAWLDLIYEEDDIFYVFKESIWRNTIGSKMAGSSARWVRKVLEALKQLTPTKK